MYILFTHTWHIEECVMTMSTSVLHTVCFPTLTHETSFSDADVFFTFLQQKTFHEQRTGKYRSRCDFTTVSCLTCRKCASTMFMYMSSSSRPLPMKHRCSPLAMEPDSKDCFWASNRDFTDRANSEGFWSICEKKGHNYHFMNMCTFSTHLNTEQMLSPGQSPDERPWTGALNCTAPQADNPPQRNGPHPENRNYHIRRGQTHKTFLN